MSQYQSNIYCLIGIFFPRLGLSEEAREEGINLFQTHARKIFRKRNYCEIHVGGSESTPFGT